MTCDSKGPAIRMGSPDGPRIGTLVRERRLAVFPVTYERHLFYDCGKMHRADDEHSWTLDAQTLLHYRRAFDIMEFHLTRVGVSVPFRIAADVFVRAGHSSFDCDDRHRARSEKWHCPWRHFQFDEVLAGRYPPPARAEQAALL